MIYEGVNHTTYSVKVTYDMLIKIRMDGVGGFMKMCMSIFELNSNNQGETSGYGKRLGEKFKDSGVKKNDGNRNCTGCARKLCQREDLVDGSRD